MRAGLFENVMDTEQKIIFHELKTWTSGFDASWRGLKPWEFRRDDREFKMGHKLILREYDRESDSYTGRKIHADISYKLNGPAYGIPNGYCILTMKITELEDSFL